jgi:BMFP domain-containing protein YqiC
MENPMDPLRTLIEYLQENFRDKLPAQALAGIEGTARDLFAKFELVPKHEYEAHVDILASLEAQVTSLEARLNALEQPA